MVTPLGNDPESTWASLVAGESGAGPITRFDTSEYAVRFACELKDYDPTTWIDRKQARRMDVFSQFALSAARMAEADSGIDIAASPTASARPSPPGSAVSPRSRTASSRLHRARP